MILSAIFIPCYQSFIHQSTRHRAEIEMFNLSSNLQDYYAKHKSYLGAQLQNPLHAYFFQLSQVDEQNFTITATPQGTQTKDACGVLSLNNLGIRLAQQPNCW